MAIGDNLARLRRNLEGNLNAIMQQVAWDGLEFARSLADVSKGTLLSSWTLSNRTVQIAPAETEFAPYSWMDGNDLSRKYSAHVQQTFQTAQQVRYSIPVFLSNATPYLTQNVNTNPHLGGQSSQALGADTYTKEIATFMQGRLRGLLAQTNLAGSPGRLQT